MQKGKISKIIVFPDIARISLFAVHYPLQISTLILLTSDEARLSAEVLTKAEATSDDIFLAFPTNLTKISPE